MKKYIAVALSALMIMFCLPSLSVLASEYTLHFKADIGGALLDETVVANEQFFAIFYRRTDNSFNSANGLPWAPVQFEYLVLTFDDVHDASCLTHVSDSDATYSFVYRYDHSYSYTYDGGLNRLGSAKDLTVSGFEFSADPDALPYQYHVCYSNFDIRTYDGKTVWLMNENSNLLPQVPSDAKLRFKGLNSLGYYTEFYSACERLAVNPYFKVNSNHKYALFVEFGVPYDDSFFIVTHSSSDSNSSIQDISIASKIGWSNPDSEIVCIYDYELGNSGGVVWDADVYGNPDCSAIDALSYNVQSGKLWYDPSVLLFSVRADYDLYLRNNYNNPTPTPTPTLLPTPTPTLMPTPEPTQAPQVIIIQPDHIDHRFDVDVPDVMDAVGAAQDGFGLLGSNGFLAMLREATSFIIPEAFWDLILWALGIGLAIALVKLIF